MTMKHFAYSSCTLALVVVLACVAFTPVTTALAPFKVTTVYLVRHAEKQATPPADPLLTAAGTARAERLAMILAQAGLKAIYTSQYLRTQHTAKPVAQSLGITPTVINVETSPAPPGQTMGSQMSAPSLQAFVDKITQHPGETALIVGHTNTLPAIIGKLGGDVVPTIPETDFDNLFVVTIYANGKAKVAQLKY